MTRARDLADSADKDIAGTVTLDDIILSNDITLADNGKAIFGAGSDLQIYHDGSNSFITDFGTGYLHIRSSTEFKVQNAAGTANHIKAVDSGAVELFYNGASKLATTSTGIDVTGDATFADNGKAIFGAGSDLQIYHDGTRNYIDSDTTELRLQTSELRMVNSSNTEIGLKAVEDGAVTLYYDANPKLATTSTGVDITGTLVSDGLTVDGSTTLNGLNSDLILQGTTSGSQDANEIKWRSTTSSGYDLAKIKVVVGSNFYDGNLVFQTQRSGYAGALADRMKLENTGDITFYDTDGTTASFVYDASAGTTFNEAGADRDFRVESDSKTHALFVDAGTGQVLFGKSSASNDVNVAGAFINLSDAKTVITSGSTNQNLVLAHYSASGDRTALEFYYNGSSVGFVKKNSSGTTYNTTSDRRLKTDIQPIANGTEKLMAMNPVTHKWKADPHTGETVHGFIAQEMQDVIPEAVSGDPNGEEMMSMDYGRITPVLVAALQDAHKKIAELETRLITLEGK